MTPSIPDIFNTNGKDVRFLFNRGDQPFCLFSFSFKRDEFYFAISQKKVRCIPAKGQPFQIRGHDFGITLNQSQEEQVFTSLKFSFHASGQRHLKAINSDKRDFIFYKSNKTKFSDIQSSEHLFKLVTKHLDYYEPYRYKSRTRKGRNAVSLETPSGYSNCKRIFDFHISNRPEKT